MSYQKFKRTSRAWATVAIASMAGLFVAPEAYAQTSDKTVYTSVETLPEFPGGIKGFTNYVKSNLRYPAEAQKQKVQGRVNVSFVVEPNGKLSEVKAVGRPQPLLQDEAIRVMKASPLWTAGKQDGKAVRVQYTVPIIFALKS
jgi:periplasmic protein TonB